MSTDQLKAHEAVGFQGVRRQVHSIDLPPMISLPGSGIESISLWVVLGVGGGFVRVPMLVYVLGIPTHMAVGTDLFEIVISPALGR